MSYNIDTWKTKELIELKLPIQALYEIDQSLINRGWKPDAPIITSRPDAGYMLVHINCPGGEIKGELSGDGMLTVESLDFHGECSGNFTQDVLEPALEKSTGTLVAVRVWEGGDSVDRLTVKDGVVTSEQVEL